MSKKTKEKDAEVMDFMVCCRPAKVIETARRTIALAKLLEVKTFDELLTDDGQSAIKERLFKVYESGRASELYKAVFDADFSGIPDSAFEDEPIATLMVGLDAFFLICVTDTLKKRLQLLSSQNR